MQLSLPSPLRKNGQGLISLTFPLFLIDIRSTANQLLSSKSRDARMPSRYQERPCQAEKFEVIGGLRTASGHWRTRTPIVRFEEFEEMWSHIPTAEGKKIEEDIIRGLVRKHRPWTRGEELDALVYCTYDSHKPLDMRHIHRHLPLTRYRASEFHCL